MKHAPRILIILLLASLFLGGIFPAQAAPNLVGTPVLIAYDSFTRADGSIGSTETTGPASESLSAYAWTGGTLSGNKNVIAPTLGSELITNGDFSSAEPPGTTWNRSSGWTIADTTANHVANGTNNTLTQTVTSSGSWYKVQFDITSISSGGVSSNIGSIYNQSRTTTGTFIDTNRAGSTPGGVRANTTFTGSIDNLSIKLINLPSTFSTISTNDPDIVAAANVVLTSGTQAGIISNLDSSNSPSNFVIAYHNGTNIRLEKYVSGTYTTLINTAVTYVSGAVLRLEKDGTTYKLFYNGSQVSTDQTISDAGIINNTIHGLFSTYSGNTFDNFYLYDNNPATATPTSTATFTATATQTETPTFTATGTLEPTYTPTITATPSNTPEPTATATWAPVILPTLNAEEFTLSSGHTFQVERRATFGEVGVMLSLLCISVPFGALAFLSYLNKKR